jgi:hypothetical protein
MWSVFVDWFIVVGIAADDVTASFDILVGFAGIVVGSVSDAKVAPTVGLLVTHEGNDVGESEDLLALTTR